MAPLRLAVIGDPISHSRSPAIHNSALAALGLEGIYVTRHVTSKEGVEEIFAEIRRGDLDGVNVTMPHKVTAAALCDDLTPDAKAANSVNTVVRQPDGGLLGHTTDVTGLRSLWQRKMPSGHPVLVLGTGGAAAAACLAAQGRSVYVSARRAEAVGQMAEELALPVMPLPWQAAVVDAIVVNATPLGMEGEPLHRPTVELSAALIDMAYGSQPTPAVELARSFGLAVVDGIDVLVAQAAHSFRLWTGREAPLDVMTEAARKPSSPVAAAPN